MALCLPRSRRAASLATRPSTLSVASITNHSCFTSAGLALTVVVIRLSSLVWRALFHGRCPSGGDLLGGHSDWCAPGACRHGRCLSFSVAGPLESLRNPALYAESFGGVRASPLTPPYGPRNP